MAGSLRRGGEEARRGFLSTFPQPPRARSSPSSGPAGLSFFLPGRATGANRFSMVNEPPSGNSLGDTKYSRIVRAYARVEKRRRRRRRKYMRAKERRLPDRSAADGAAVGKRGIRGKRG